MKTFVFTKLFLVLYSCVLTTTLSTTAPGQSAEGRSRNNPYSPSPKGKISPIQPSTSDTLRNDGNVSFVMNRNEPSSSKDVTNEPRPSIAQATFKIAKAAEAKSVPPTEVYKVGIGDVIYVGLRNSPQGSGYYTVRPDGTIDYPLAGENVKVIDQTVDSIEETLASAITLFSDPQVEVKVRQFASHRISVSGLVENGGEKFLQREAMPLFAIRAEAVPSSKATKVAIRRGNDRTPEVFDINDPKAENVLIFSGDSVEFTGESVNAGSAAIYFIGGEVASGGQKELTTGLTLYQAIIASGGAKGDPKKVIIRRKNEKGLFAVQEFNLRSIKAGKAMDPFLAPGDVIEIEK